MTVTEPVAIDTLPFSAADFAALQERYAHTPEGGAALAVLALVAWTQDQPLGEEFLALAAAPECTSAAPGRTSRVLRARERALLRSRLGEYGYLPYAYLLGSTPANRYAMPPLPLRVSARATPSAEAGRVIVLVDCSGAEAPRPVTMTRDEAGLWRARDWSALLAPVQEPERF